MSPWQTSCHQNKWHLYRPYIKCLRVIDKYWSVTWSNLSVYPGYRSHLNPHQYILDQIQKGTAVLRFSIGNSENKAQNPPQLQMGSGFPQGTPAHPSARWAQGFLRVHLPTPAPDEFRVQGFLRVHVHPRPAFLVQLLQRAVSASRSELSYNNCASARLAKPRMDDLNDGHTVPLAHCLTNQMPLPFMDQSWVTIDVTTQLAGLKHPLPIICQKHFLEPDSAWEPVACTLLHS